MGFFILSFAIEPSASVSQSTRTHHSIPLSTKTKNTDNKNKRHSVRENSKYFFYTKIIINMYLWVYECILLYTHIQWSDISKQIHRCVCACVCDNNNFYCFFLRFECHVFLAGHTSIHSRILPSKRAHGLVAQSVLFYFFLHSFISRSIE